jgi:RNA polymerase sigma factor (sigma-70 family)
MSFTGHLAPRSTPFARASSGDTLRNQQLARSPIPSPEQEREWTWQNYHMQQLLNAGATVDRKCGVLTIGGDIDKAAIACGISEGDARRAIVVGMKARDELILRNRRLVLKVAGKWSKCGIPFEDLEQVGIDGLIHALTKFEPQRGYKLSTYATPWIWQRINREMMMSNFIRLPFHIQERSRSIKAIRRSYHIQFGVMPSIEYVAERSGLSEQMIQECDAATQIQVHSLDLKIGKDVKDRTLIDIIEAPETDLPDRFVEKQEVLKRFKDALECMSESQQLVIKKRLLDLRSDGRMKSFLLIGKEVGFTKARTQRLGKQGMALLKAKMGD